MGAPKTAGRVDAPSSDAAVARREPQGTHALIRTLYGPHMAPPAPTSAKGSALVPRGFFAPTSATGAARPLRTPTSVIKAEEMSRFSVSACYAAGAARPNFGPNAANGTRRVDAVSRPTNHAGAPAEAPAAVTRDGPQLVALRAMPGCTAPRVAVAREHACRAGEGRTAAAPGAARTTATRFEAVVAAPTPVRRVSVSTACIWCAARAAGPRGRARTVPSASLLALGRRTVEAGVG